VVASGPGAGARNSIGMTLVTGMVIGTVFTLFVVPAIYMLVASARERIRARSAESLELGPTIAEVAPVPAQ
jgi:multidrug efflux pump